MLDTATMIDPAPSDKMGGEVRTLTIAKAHVGTCPTAYHLWVSAARFMVKRTYGTSFTIEMHVAGFRTVAMSEITSSVNTAMRGTMNTMAPTMTIPTDIALQLEDIMKG
jgi:hypothetical protein